MKKQMFLTMSSVVALTAAMQATAATYDVSGAFTGSSDPSRTLGVHLGSPNLAVTAPGSTPLFVGGTIETDGTAPGYNITGGTITLSGIPFLDLTSTPLAAIAPLFFIGVQGDATNAGVVFDQGEVCFGSTTNCTDLAATMTAVDDDMDPNTPDIMVPVDNKLYFDGSKSFGFAMGPGLQLTSGAGGAAFTVAQPGMLGIDGGANLAVGVATLLGNTAGIFFSGDLTMTEQTVVPVPAAAWLFGSAILGLAGVARRKRLS